MKSFNVLLLFLVATAVVNAGQVVIKLRNDSNDYLSAHWVHPEKRTTTLIKGDINPRSAFQLNSYLNHEFEIWQQRDPVTGLCGSGQEEECDAIGYFKVTEEPEQCQ